MRWYTEICFGFCLRRFVVVVTVVDNRPSAGLRDAADAPCERRAAPGRDDDLMSIPCPAIRSLRYAECRASDRLFIPDGVYSQIGHDSLEYQWKVPPTDADAQHWHRTRPTHSRSLAQHYNTATAARPWTLYRVDQATSTLPPGTHWRSESDWDCPLQQLTRSRHGTVTRERHWHGHGVSATSRVTSRG